MNFLFRGLPSLLLLALLALSGCDRMVTPRSTQAVQDARRKASDGEYLAAIELYESALDGSARSADTHYQLALLYDDKLKEPLHALHHFKRYLTLAPSGPHAAEVKNLMKRDELEVITSLSDDPVVTRTEAARLRNDNLKLQRQLEERGNSGRAVTRATEKAPVVKADSAGPRSSPSAPRTHVVEPGDTLFSLSRKYYHSPDRWKDILEANKKGVNEPGKLQVGQTLTIP